MNALIPTNTPLTADQQNAIKRPLPKEAVSAHPTKAGMSSIRAIYVTERLNEVFGVGGWSLRVEPITVTPEGLPFTTKNFTTSNNKPRTEFHAVTKTVFDVPAHNLHYEVIAGATNDDLGDAFKGSTTDALTKIASWIGIGIAVFKSQQDQALRQYDEQLQQDQNIAAYEKEVQEAIKALSTCKTVDALKELKGKTAADVLTDERFKEAAKKRFDFIQNTPAPKSKLELAQSMQQQIDEMEHIRQEWIDMIMGATDVDEFNGIYDQMQSAELGQLKGALGMKLVDRATEYGCILTGPEGNQRFILAEIEQAA